MPGPITDIHELRDAVHKALLELVDVGQLNEVGLVGDPHKVVFGVVTEDGDEFFISIEPA